MPAVYKLLPQDAKFRTKETKTVECRFKTLKINTESLSKESKRPASIVQRCRRNPVDGKCHLLIWQRCWLGRVTCARSLQLSILAHRVALRLHCRPYTSSSRFGSYRGLLQSSEHTHGSTTSTSYSITPDQFREVPSEANVCRSGMGATAPIVLCRPLPLCAA